MPKMNIERSIKIDASKEKVFQKLNDFNEWMPWSPWLIMEPEAKVNVAEDSKSYEWEGDRIGSGNMKVLKEDGYDFIEYDLNFIKPWKSHALTSFKLKEEGSSTVVTWYMDSALPFFMFWMKKMMEAFVGADYERGLDMLKAYVEDGEVESKMEFVGNKSIDRIMFVGVKSTCSMDDLGTQMANDFEKLRAALESSGKVKGALSIYHKWDVVKGNVSYTSAMIVSDYPSSDSEFVKGEIPPADVYSLKHIGKYQHLGNAWSTLYSMQRNKEFKINKNIDPFEIYLNDPSNTPEKELVTEINFPIK